jgi:hypothetical protein
MRILKFEQWLSESYLAGGRGPLYHSTRFEKLLGILNTNALVANPDDNTISCSRSLDFVFLNHPIIIVLDTEKIRSNHSIHSFDWMSSSIKGYRPKGDPARTLEYENEDRIDGTIQPLDKYIIEILVYKRPFDLEGGVDWKWNMISAIRNYANKHPHVKFKFYDKDVRKTEDIQLSAAA